MTIAKCYHEVGGLTFASPPGAEGRRSCGCNNRTYELNTTNRHRTAGDSDSCDGAADEVQGTLEIRSGWSWPAHRAGRFRATVRPVPAFGLSTWTSTRDGERHAKKRTYPRYRRCSWLVAGCRSSGAPVLCYSHVMKGVASQSAMRASNARRASANPPDVRGTAGDRDNVCDNRKFPRRWPEKSSVSRRRRASGNQLAQQLMQRALQDLRTGDFVKSDSRTDCLLEAATWLHAHSAARTRERG